MKKVKVNQDACIGCGACVSMANEYFDFNDEGYSEAIKEVIEDSDLELVEDAASCCPVDAISISDDKDKADNAN